jgi:hypothetical protein
MMGALTRGTTVEINSSVAEAAPQMIGLRATVLKTYKSKGRLRVKLSITEDNPCYRVGEEIYLPVGFVTPIERQRDDRA